MSLSVPSKTPGIYPFPFRSQPFSKLPTPHRPEKKKIKTLGRDRALSCRRHDNSPVRLAHRAGKGAGQRVELAHLQTEQVPVGIIGARGELEVA